MTKTIGDTELSHVWADSGLKVEPSEAKRSNGWDLGEQPPHEYANQILYELYTKMNALLKNSAAPYNANNTYDENDLVNHNGVIYRSKEDSNTATPPNVKWQAMVPYSSSKSIVNGDDGFELDGDEETPGNSKYYGTNGSGDKGWYDTVNDAFTTGDFKISINTGALAGYVRCNGGTIGNASSGATERANADTEDLYTVLWDISSLSVSGSRGASAAADFAANKTIQLPDARNNVLAFLDGMGNSNTNRLTTANGGIDGKTLCAIGGSQEHQLTVAQMPSHQHPVKIGHVSFVSSGDVHIPDDTWGAETDGNVNAAGGDEAHPNVQPTIIIGTLYIKL